MARVVTRCLATAAVLAGLLALGAPASAATASQQGACYAGKLKCISKKGACILKEYSKAQKKGTAIPADKLQKCYDKFDGGTKGTAAGCFGKLETKYGIGTSGDQCPTGGDMQAMEYKVDAFVADVLEELDPLFDINNRLAARPLSKCLSGKTKCVIKKGSCVLKEFEKAAKVGTTVPDPAKLQKCYDKFDGGTKGFAAGCFGKLEIKGGNKGGDATCVTGLDLAGDKKDPVYIATLYANSDMLAIENKVDAFVDDVITELNFGEQKIDSRRCFCNSAQSCNTHADCPGACPCVYYFGTNLPLSAGGISTCVQNTFDGSVSGTVNVETGESAGTANLVARVYSGPSAHSPCPQCRGDTWANDGVRGGTCNHGTRAGLPCDVSGSSPNAHFGDTSLDCPPLPLALIATLPIDLDNTTGTKTKALTAASPKCRAAGFTTQSCFCDTCDNAAATPCSSNADCGGGICGGKRCQGGSNNGDPCTTGAGCPGGTCGVPGLATRPNACEDETCTADGGNEGKCAAGPVEQFCGPTATFVQCNSDAECAPYGGDTCSVVKFRDCFTDNGTLGGVLKATGKAVPPVDHWSRPTLASLFCIGPTSTAVVNSVAGLPGPGRLELVGVARDNGTDTTCPTTIDFQVYTGRGVLDRGWTGTSHDAQIVSKGLVTVQVTCGPLTPPCGVCTYTGPVPN